MPPANADQGEINAEFVSSLKQLSAGMVASNFAIQAIATILQRKGIADANEIADILEQTTKAEAVQATDPIFSRELALTASKLRELSAALNDRNSR